MGKRLFWTEQYNHHWSVSSLEAWCTSLKYKCQVCPHHTPPHCVSHTTLDTSQPSLFSFCFLFQLSPVETCESWTLWCEIKWEDYQWLSKFKFQEKWYSNSKFPVREISRYRESSDEGNWIGDLKGKLTPSSLILMVIGVWKVPWSCFAQYWNVNLSSQDTQYESCLDLNKSEEQTVVTKAMPKNILINGRQRQIQSNTGH